MRGGGVRGQRVMDKYKGREGVKVTYLLMDKYNKGKRDKGST